MSVVVSGTEKMKRFELGVWISVTILEAFLKSGVQSLEPQNKTPVEKQIENSS